MNGSGICLTDLASRIMMIASMPGSLERIREALIVGLIAILVGLAVYSFLGFAWTVKAAVETSQKLRHSTTSR